jgi:hypothetical protein
MRVVKLLGVIMGILLLTILVPVVIGMIGRSLIALLFLLVLGIGAAAFTWRRGMDSIARPSWFIRLHDRGGTRAHDRLVQDDDDMRDHTHEQQQRRRH